MAISRVFENSGSQDPVSEDLTNQIDGQKKIFSSSSDFIEGSVDLYWNGIKQINGVQFSEVSSSGVETDFTPSIRDHLEIKYIPS